MSSLQDQLLKAGLVGEKQAKQVSKQKRKQAKIQNKSNQPVVDETKLKIQQDREEKAARDRQLNAQRKAEADQKAIAAQIKQLIERNLQSKGGGDQAYNFTDGTKIKKIYVSPAVFDQLSRGRLAIVRLGDSYELVPLPVADKIAERDASIVVSVSAKQDQVDEDDPYAEYEIPDDLMW